MRDRARVLGVIASMTLVLATRAARAEDDCPIGSAQKTEHGETWCEPTVCDTDTNCATGLICRPIALCVEIGVLDVKTDAGQKLLVRQRCGENKSCPQKTACSEKGRCISRAQAEKAGLLTTTAGATSAPISGSTSDAPPAKKACGCSVPGSSRGATSGALLAVLGLIAASARRRARRP